MCLIDPIKLTKNKGLSFNEITVYKVFRRNRKTGQIISLYRDDFVWKTGEVMTAKGKTLSTKTLIDTAGTAHIILDGAALHSFRNIKDADKLYVKAIKEEAEEDTGSSIIIAECVIPEDSEFVYLGAYTHTDDSYASEKLKIVEILEEKI